MIRSGSRKIEKDLIKKANALLRDNSILIPECGDKCLICPFKNLRKALDKVSAKSEDENALIRLSKRGNPIAMAYAVILLVRLRRKVPYMANIRLPGIGNISFVMWGKAPREKQIGIQYYDNPALRLMAYFDIAKKKKIHLYSLSDKIICTGGTPGMPLKLIREVLADHPLKLKVGKDKATCGHKRSRYLEIYIRSADYPIRICSSCADRMDRKNTVHMFVERLAAPYPTADFVPRVMYDIDCVKGDKCTLLSLKEDWEGYEKYLEGEISDDSILDKFQREVFKKEVERQGIYVAGSKCYEKDVKAFIKDLTPNKMYRKAVYKALKLRKRGLFLEKPSVSTILSMAWKKHGAKIMASVVKDKAVIKDIMHMKGMSPIEAIDIAKIMEKQKKMLKDYPEVRYNAPIIELADRAARLYKVSAMDELDSLLERFEAKDNMRVKALKYAIAKAVGINVERHGWRCTPREKEFGDFLVPQVKEFFDADEASYVAMFESLVSLTASGHKIELRK